MVMPSGGARSFLEIRHRRETPEIPKNYSLWSIFYSILSVVLFSGIGTAPAIRTETGAIAGLIAGLALIIVFTATALSAGDKYKYGRSG